MAEIHSATGKSYFIQEPPHLGNQYLEDSALCDILHRLMPDDVLAQIEPDLIRFGDRVLKDILEYGRESERNPPKLVQVDAFGRRIDDVKVTHGWKELQKISAEEGLIAIPYERKFNEFSRLYQFVKIYLFGPSSGVFGCPLAMTDGAARLVEVWGTEDQKKNVLKNHLASRDPKNFWTSGQWMTERTGGSDVGNTETIAKLRPDGLYDISGYKFFTSAITSEMTVLLARIVDSNGQSIEGSKGLSTFYVELRKPDGSLNGISVHKLKEKLGTKAVPTAELELKNTLGKLIGTPNKGVPVISSILNITRIHNAVTSVSFMRRAIAVARDYAHRRKVFGKMLSEQPLHLSTLASMELEFRGCLQFMTDVIVLHGKSECGKISQDEDVLFRFLTPLLKLYTAKQSISVISEAIESLGGTGYMEDSDMPRLLRDTQVTSIWEGTTNVLSLDVWRPIRANNALEIFASVVEKKIGKISLPSLKEAGINVKRALEGIHKFAMRYLGTVDKDMIEASARDFSFALSKTYIGSLLLEHAQWSNQQTDIEIAKRWNNEQNLVHLIISDENYRYLTKKIAMDVDLTTGFSRGTGDKTSEGLPRARY